MQASLFSWTLCSRPDPLSTCLPLHLSASSSASSTYSRPTPKARPYRCPCAQAAPDGLGASSDGPYIGNDGRRKATWEEAFRTSSRRELQKESTSAGVTAPWNLSWQMNERKVVWTDELKQRLVQKIAARDLGIAEDVMAERLQDLQTLLPDLVPKMKTMKPKLLARLAADAPTLATKLVVLKAIFPAANAAAMVARRPALVLKDDLEVIKAGAVRLRSLLPEVDIDRMVEQHPSMLDVDSFEQALAEAKRLMPNLDINKALNHNPSVIFSFQRGSQLIPYDEVPNGTSPWNSI